MKLSTPHVQLSGLPSSYPAGLDLFKFPLWPLSPCLCQFFSSGSCWEVISPSCVFFSSVSYSRSQTEVCFSLEAACRAPESAGFASYLFAVSLAGLVRAPTAWPAPCLLFPQPQARLEKMGHPKLSLYRSCCLSQTHILHWLVASQSWVLLLLLIFVIYLL